MHTTSDAPRLPGTGEPGRWIVYLSPDRRVLWIDNGGNGREPDCSFDNHTDLRDLPPELREWNDLLDAAYETRMPQAGRRRLCVDGVERVYTLKAFPDFGLDGEFKGIIQVVEPGDYHTGTALRRTITALLDLTLTGAILYDPTEDCILNVNRRAAQQIGYSLAELEKVPGKTLFGENGAALLRNIFSRMTVSGEAVVWGQILPILDHYGRRRSYFCSLRPVPRHPVPDSSPAMLISLDEQSNPAAGMTGVGPNPRFVTDALQEGLWNYDTLERTFHYGASFVEIMGPDGAPGGPGLSMDEWLEAVHPTNISQIFMNWRNLLKKGLRYQVQYRIRDRNGDWRWIFSTILAVLNDERGRPRTIIGSHSDITPAIHTERNLADAEERLRAIFENTGGGIAVAGQDGVLLQVNPALAIILGRDREDCVGHRLSDFAHDDDREEMRSILYRITRGGRRETMADVRFLRPDGGMIWINLNVTLSGMVNGGGRYVILMADDVSESHDTRVRMQYEATHDVMTGAWTRWVLFERLEQHLQLAMRHKSPMTFCICDLDHFKNVNDMYGHQAGDKVLVEFVKILREAVRETDIIGRYGGEEFGIVFPQTSIEDAMQPIERARRILGERVFRGASGDEFSVTATFGLAGATGASAVKTLVADADAALYEGKRNGRDRVVACRARAGEAWM